MDKKIISRITSTNLGFLIATIFATFTFIDRLLFALWPIQHGGILNKIDYSLIQLTFNITEQGGYNHAYTVTYYPLIGIVAGIIYNSFVKIKNYRSERNENLKL